MKFKVLFFVLAIQLYIFTPLHLYCEQKLYNITEDTLAEDSYRPVAGKEFLVAVKLVDVDTETNTEQTVSNETIIFQASAGTLSGLEVITNIYGEAITWLKTADIADTLHSITTSVKDKPEVAPINIEVKNIALPQDAPTAEELIQQVEENNDKIEDIKGDITVTSNAPWGVSTRVLKIWKKGDKQKVEEISPKPGVFVRPPIPEPPANFQVNKEIVLYNPATTIYGVEQKIATQESRYPYSIDFVDVQKSVILKQQSCMGDGETKAITKFITLNESYQWQAPVWIFYNQKRYSYQGISQLLSTEEYSYSNIEINTGLADSLFQ